MRLVFPDWERLRTQQGNNPAYWKFCAGYTKTEPTQGAIFISMGARHGHQQFLTGFLVHGILTATDWAEVHHAPLYVFEHMGKEACDGHWRQIGKEWYESESAAIEAKKG
jgi:hypothetical protein